eukprot:SAG11_NODE_719_length_7564_cov_14.939317_3_plen_68_part_00
MGRSKYRAEISIDQWRLIFLFLQFLKILFEVRQNLQLFRLKRFFKPFLFILPSFMRFFTPSAIFNYM